MKASVMMVLLQVSATPFGPTGEPIRYHRTPDDRLLYEINTTPVGPDGVPIGRGLQNRPASREPTRAAERRLLHAFGVPQVQIYAKCFVDARGAFTRCDLQGLTPERGGSREAAIRFLDEFRVDPSVRGSKGLAMNRVAISVLVSAETLIRNSELCADPLFCGIPTPIPPANPRLDQPG